MAAAYRIRSSRLAWVGKRHHGPKLTVDDGFDLLDRALKQLGRALLADNSLFEPHLDVMLTRRRRLATPIRLPSVRRLRATVRGWA